MSNSNPIIIQHTKNWVEKVVIGLNLCPFASQPFQNNAIEYTVITGDSLEQHLQALAEGFSRLDASPEIETSLLIYSQAYRNFDDYLELLDFANHLLNDLNYSGTYQVASFHPDYCFEGSDENDASNFTNRSPYPMLHLIREDDLEAAISSYPDIEQVPENNINKLRLVGYEMMRKKLKDTMA